MGKISQKPSIVLTFVLKNTGMSRNRFDDIWNALVFSDQGDNVDGESSIEYLWRLIDGFVEAINSHRASNYTPSELICVDESISRWCGQGGSWIEHGLPCYVAIDLNLSMVARSRMQLAGGVVMKLFSCSWSPQQSTNMEGRLQKKQVFSTVRPCLTGYLDPGLERETVIVCADSYFASYEATQHLRGLRFIGIVKTATKQYQTRLIQAKTISNRGRWLSFANEKANRDVLVMALVWVDRERMYFIASPSSAIAGTPYDRIRWRQTDDCPRRQRLTVEQLKVAEVYYSACARIDQHNRCRRDDLGLKRSLQTHDRSVLVNLTLLGMIVVDSWLLHTGARGPLQTMLQNEFYESPALELIDNNFK
jgi:Transposase IS4